MIPHTQKKKYNAAAQTPVMSGCGSWVICDSKSRPGLKYYFNTESGEAVWNLDDKTQIEKAKRHTQLLHTKLGTVPVLPEPQDQPPLDAQRDFNLPIMNQMSNFCNMVNMGSRSYNGNVWANPPAVVQQPQFVLVPAVTPMMNPSMGNNSLHPTLGLPFTYQNYGNYNTAYDNSNTRNVPNKMSNFRGRTFHRKGDCNSNFFRQGGDLRQKLGRKRSFSETRPACTQDYFNSNNSDQNSPENEATKDNKRFRLNSLKIDESYVVVDKDILLNEFVFFDNLVSNDRNFRLVVPHYVMSELKKRACNNGEMRVRRIVRFLSQKIESQVVYLGEEIEENSCQNENKTFITCQKLVEDYDTNVILVSNESEMRKFSGTNEKIEIMSMNNFKDVLSNNKVRFLSPSARAIKIVIPNNIEHVRTDDISIGKEIGIEKVDNIVQRDELDSSFEEYNDTKVESEVPNIEPKETSLQCMPSPSFKRTVDTAVQTEIEKELNTTSFISSDTNVEVDTVMRNENGIKKRDFRLNRHNPMKKARFEEPEDKKQFKWRKNRASSNNKQVQATSYVSSPTKNIIKAAKDIIQNTTEADTNITESKKTETNSLTYTEKSLTIPNTNSNKSSAVDREQAKVAPNLVTDKDTIIHKENLRHTSTETWVESVLKSKSETDKDSKCSSHKSVNDTNSSNSTQAKKVNSVVRKMPTKPAKKNIVLKNVTMFTISGNMEEALRMRSDEWMSRFVQIMEEILKEKLQENPPFESCEYPPPWNLHEAAKCIIKKYSNYCNVVDAANKLSFILYKISDEKGTMQLSLQPSEFMEMYSYGVYLVETLLDVSINCEDLHAAKKLLDVLLNDIQNANTENNFSDVFHDDPNESFVENTTSTDITESDFRPCAQQSTPKKKTQNNCAKKTNLKKVLKPELLYNLRSDKKTSEAPEVCQSVSPIVPDKKSNFLSNLKLITRTISSSSTITSPAYSNLTERSPVNSPLAAASRLITDNRENNFEERVKSPLAIAAKVISNEQENVTEKITSPLTVTNKVIEKERENSIEEPIKSPLAVTSQVTSNNNFNRETVKSPLTMIARVISNNTHGNDIEENTTKVVDNNKRENKTKEPFKSPLAVATKVASRKQENNIKEFNKNCDDIVSSSGQPSFVRNFQVYPEFEARITKARRILAHDYDESYLDDGNCDDNAFDFDISQYFKLKNCFSKEFKSTLKDVAAIDDNSNRKELNEFALSVGNFQLRSIQETFAEVREMLAVTKSDPSKREELKMMTIKMVPRIKNIYNSLTTILKDNDHDNIKELLRDVNAHSEDQEMFCLKYRKMVAKCRGQACIIIKYLQRILCTS